MVNNSEGIAIKSRFSDYLAWFFCNIGIGKPQIPLCSLLLIVDSGDRRQTLPQR